MGLSRAPVWSQLSDIEHRTETKGLPDTGDGVAPLNGLTPPAIDPQMMAATTLLQTVNLTIGASDTRRFA